MTRDGLRAVMREMGRAGGLAARGRSGRKATCACGECAKCRRREKQRSYRAKQVNARREPTPDEMRAGMDSRLFERVL